MTAPTVTDRAVTDPIGLIVDMVAAIEPDLTTEQIGTVVTCIAGGRAKSRRLAGALAQRPGILVDGRSPAARVVGDLLIGLRRAGAAAVSPPCCCGCGRQLRTLQRQGQDWFCARCLQPMERCVQCGRSRRTSSRDRAGQPRCQQCPDRDGRDPVEVIADLIVTIDPHVDRASIADAVRRSAPRPSYQQRLAWALEEQPGLLTGQGHLAPLRAIPRLIEALHAAGVAGIIRPACPRCHRVVPIDKPLDHYLIWNLLRRLRNRAKAQHITRQQSLLVRGLAHGAVAFLDWLDARELTLGTCQQADLDRWHTDPSGTYRKEVGQLVRWARRNKLTTVEFASTRWNGPAQPLDHQHRWDTARRLLHDENLKPEDRLAGLLVLFYAQGATAISRLTTKHINVYDGDVRLRLGRVPIHLPEPVATIARTVAANRKGHATIGAANPSPWLFPGGQPGRPISSARLTERLNRLGILPSQDRSTALFQLATEVPAAILARTLGIHTDVAVIWQRHAAGDWTTYAAEVSRSRSAPAPGSRRP